MSLKIETRFSFSIGGVIILKSKPCWPGLKVAKFMFRRTGGVLLMIVFFGGWDRERSWNVSSASWIISIHQLSSPASTHSRPEVSTFSTWGFTLTATGSSRLTSTPSPTWNVSTCCPVVITQVTLPKISPTAWPTDLEGFAVRRWTSTLGWRN